MNNNSNSQHYTKTLSIKCENLSARGTFERPLKINAFRINFEKISHSSRRCNLCHSRFLRVNQVTGVRDNVEVVYFWSVSSF